MPNFVPDSGPLSALALVIGEAPGREEDKRRRPFLGPAGMKLTRFTKIAGIDRLKELRITNTYPYHPPNNVLAAVPREDRERELQRLYDTIDNMPNLKLLIPMGAYALEAILPGRPPKHTITNIRGSIYPYAKRKGVLVLPMVHPELTLYEDRYTRGAIKDWQRARLLMNNPRAWQPLRRDHEIMPSMQRVREYRRECQSLGLKDCLAVDIETPEKVTRKLVGYFKNGKPKWKKIVGARFIASIAFAASSTHSLTIPLTRAYWGRDVADAWDEVELILDSKAPKVFHNGMFDCWHLARVKMPVRNWWWDTKDMHHCLDAWEQHSLAYCASTDTWEPYWKDESGGHKGMPNDEFLRQYWIYNGKDAAVTRELQPIYRARLESMP